ncbi:hypothetical protein CesoFtcFv8_026054 [Champsocephalus esox]|uniref:Cyclin-dependent kinase 17 n=2 Tax=Champsocephalus TaxID=52236 RepID=A0AAN8H1J0_CHAGU|nr:hypothetical protein CesoFtcFv8_026054 [Champsocephalus esox]KAK5895929.1 hypothetical protein CgunFtcFv8_009582 [Champsocephalus gunnari]
MEKMKRIKKRLSLTLRSSQTIDESLSELAEQMTIEDGGTKDNEPFMRNGRPPHLPQHALLPAPIHRVLQEASTPPAAQRHRRLPGVLLGNATQRKPPGYCA